MLARILTIGMGLALVPLAFDAAKAQTTGSVHGGGTRTSPFGAGGNAPGTQQPQPEQAPPVQQQTGAPAGGGGEIIITGEDPQLITDLLQEWGYKAKLTDDGEGNPKIESAIAGVNYQIYFYGCQSGQACSSIELSSGFNLESGIGLDVINDWHSKKRYTRAYLDDNQDPWLSMDINLYGGGITAATFQDNVYLWDSLVSDFKTQINW
jgi:hypothetical protein